MEAQTEGTHAEASGFGPGQENGVRVRPMTPEDVDAASEMCFEAFSAASTAMGLSPEFSSAQVVKWVYGSSFAEGCAGFVAVDEGGQIVGSNMLFRVDEVAVVGPLAVRAGVQTQDGGIGRLLMEAMLKAAAEQNVVHVRLNQAASKARSFSLYLGLGFEPCLSWCRYVGLSTQEAPPGFTSRAFGPGDVEACEALHFAVCGTHRHTALGRSAQAGHGVVVLDASSTLVAYCTGSGTTDHTVASDEDSAKCAIIFMSAAIRGGARDGEEVPPLTVHVPHAHAGLMRWLARTGFRLGHLGTLMAHGPWQAPTGGVYLNAITY